MVALTDGILRLVRPLEKADTVQYMPYLMAAVSADEEICIAPSNAAVCG